MPQALAIIKKSVAPVVIKPDKNEKNQPRNQEAGHEILYADRKHPEKKKDAHRRGDAPLKIQVWATGQAFFSSSPESSAAASGSAGADSDSSTGEFSAFASGSD